MTLYKPSALRILARRLALLLPPVRRIVEQRDLYVQLTQKLEADSQRLAAECRTLTEGNLELRAEVQQLNAEVQRLGAESGALLESNRELISKNENLSIGNDALRTEVGRLLAANRDLTLELEKARSLLPKPSQAVFSHVPKDTPSVFFVSLPKSGTVYTWYSLQDMTGLRMPDFHLLEGWSDYSAGRDFSCPDLYACGDYNTQLLIPEGMKHFLKGFVFGSHMQASYHNMRILKESGIRKITVLLRDPRDAFISWVHHLNKLGASARDYHSKIYHIPRAYYEWSLEKQLDYQIRTFLPITVNWVEGWLDYYASDDREIEVLFVYYDELKRDPARYIRRITEFHELENVDFSKIVIAEPGKMHYRKGEHEQWRVEFSAANQRLVEDLMQDRILRGFDAAARRHCAATAAAGELQDGEHKPAALRTIAEFPNYRPAYETLFRAADGRGLDTSHVRALVDDELREPTVAGTFIYRFRLVDACTALARDLVRGSVA